MKKRWECSIGEITFLAKIAYSTIIKSGLLGHSGNFGHAMHTADMQISRLSPCLPNLFSFIYILCI